MGNFLISCKKEKNVTEAVVEGLLNSDEFLSYIFEIAMFVV